MNAYSRGANLAAYQQTAAHGGVAAADPHRLTLMLMDGALERIAAARGCIENGALAQKAQLIHRSVAIVEELRTSLDLKTGGELAANLHALYEYMTRQLLSASLSNRKEALDEVMRLLREIRGAWVAIPQEARAMKSSP